MTDYEKDNQELINSCISIIEAETKSTLEKYCKIMSSATVAKKLKSRSTTTRRRIEEIEDQKRLRNNIELSIK